MMRLTALVVVLILTVGCHGLVEQSAGVSDSATPVSFNTAGAPTVQFTVPDMMCPEGCGAKVKEILSEQPGAKDVLVEFDSKTVTVAVDKDQFDSQKAIAALVDHQFSHAALKSASGAPFEKPMSD